MPILLTLFGSAFTAAFSFIVAKIGAKFAILVALVSVYVAAAGAFAASINGLIGSILPSMPIVVGDMFAMLPTNTDECLSVVFAAEAAAYLYRQIVIIASIKSRI